MIPCCTVTGADPVPTVDARNATRYAYCCTLFARRLAGDEEPWGRWSNDTTEDHLRELDRRLAAGKSLMGWSDLAMGGLHEDLLAMAVILARHSTHPLPLWHLWHKVRPQTTVWVGVWGAYVFFRPQSGLS